MKDNDSGVGTVVNEGDSLLTRLEEGEEGKVFDGCFGRGPRKPLGAGMGEGGLGTLGTFASGTQATVYQELQSRALVHGQRCFGINRRSSASSSI